MSKDIEVKVRVRRLQRGGSPSNITCKATIRIRSRRMNDYRGSWGENLGSGGKWRRRARLVDGALKALKVHKGYKRTDAKRRKTS